MDEYYCSSTASIRFKVYYISNYEIDLDSIINTIHYINLLIVIIDQFVIICY